VDAKEILARLAQLKEKLNPDKIELDNKKILLILLACGFIIYLELAFLLRGQLEGIGRVGPKIKRLSSDIAGLDNDLNNIQALKKKQDANKQKALQEAKRVISDDQIAALLDEISDVAEKNEVRIAQIRPLRQPLPQAAIGKGAAPAAARFSALLISMDLSADYHRLGRFINDLENGPTFLVVESLKISANPANYLKQSAQLAVRTYVKK
jgi:Tfp pilus assembly protein PilO